MQVKSSGGKDVWAGVYACLGVFILGISYAIVTLIGMLTSVSSAVPIGQPYLALMEILIILIAPMMSVSMSPFISAADITGCMYLQRSSL